MRSKRFLSPAGVIVGSLWLLCTQSLAQTSQSAANQTIRNTTGAYLEINTITGKNGQGIGREFITGKEAILDKHGHIVKGSGLIAMYKGMGYWHPLITVRNSNGKLMEIKVGVDLIAWDENGGTTKVGNIEPTLECDNGQHVQITSNRDDAIVRDGVLLLDTEIGKLSLKIAFGSSGKSIGPADFLFITDKRQLQLLREKIKAQSSTLTTKVPEMPSPRWLAQVRQRRLIAYVQENALWIMQSDGSNRKRLTEGEQRIVDPAWSPDGVRIAFLANRDLHMGYGDSLWCINADGSALHRVAASIFQITDHAWSADSKRLAYVSKEKASDPFQIHIVDVDGNKQRQITTDHADHFDPFWAPGGALLAFVSRPINGNGGGKVLIIRADGTKETRVLDDRGNASLLGWSKDGRSIAFLSESDGKTSLCIANILSLGAPPVIRRLNRSDSLAFAKLSPTGDIAFMALKDEVLDPWIMKADGSGQRRIIAYANPNGPFSFSPDGQFIILESKQHGSYELCVVGIDGKDFHQLTKTAAGDDHPAMPAWQAIGMNKAVR